MAPEHSSFYNLHPGIILSAVEALGFKPTGRYTQLNSYENRVFDLEFEGQGVSFETAMPVHKSPNSEFRLIIKIYRPQRWSRQAIQEEHDFLYALRAEGIPAVAPVKINGQSLFEFGGMFFCLFPKALGRMPQELTLPEYSEVGKKLARLHNVGAQFKPQHRPVMDTQTYGEDSLDWIDEFIYPDVRSSYFQAADEILNFLDDHLKPETFITLHGDCHKGNILQTDPVGAPKEYFFVDLDDFCVGPVVQDFWMLLSHTQIQDNPEMNHLVDGYSSLRTFDKADLKLIPGLQGLRIIYYAGWIAKRWSDPSFKSIFPQYLEYNYWAEETRALEECLRNL